MSAQRDDVHALMRQLQEGTLPPATLTGDATYHAIHELGRSQVTEAIPTIEGYITHPDAQYRYVAMEVLTNHFHLQRHWPTAVAALRRDPDGLCAYGSSGSPRPLDGRHT